MTNYLIIPLLVVMSLSNLCGQSSDYFETIHYEDGSQFIGNTIEETDHQVIFELKSSKDQITLEKSLIVEWINSNDYFILKGGRYHKKKGLFHKVEHTLGGNETDVTGQLEYIIGKMIKPRLGVGLGAGFSFNTVSNLTWRTLTFGEYFLYGKYYLNDNRVRLYVEGKVGAAVALESNNWNQYTSGPLVQPGIGFEFAKSKRFRWSIKISQFLQYTRINNDEFSNDFFSRPVSVVDKRLFNRTLVGFGFNF